MIVTSEKSIYMKLRSGYHINIIGLVRAHLTRRKFITSQHPTTNTTKGEPLIGLAPSDLS